MKRKTMIDTAKEARKIMITLASLKGFENITNEDIAEYQKQGYTFSELTAALRWLTYSPQAKTYRK